MALFSIFSNPDGLNAASRSDEDINLVHDRLEGAHLKDNHTCPHCANRIAFQNHDNERQHHASQRQSFAQLLEAMWPVSQSVCRSVTQSFSQSERLPGRLVAWSPGRLPACPVVTNEYNSPMPWTSPEIWKTQRFTCGLVF